tara:strand:- start:659 stop:1762 length:1104 start_codon:yes stop_codon:yes gene_type:complete
VFILYVFRSEDSIATLKSNTKLTYRDAGVNIDAGNALIEAIKPLAAQTARPGASGLLGGFGGLFDLKSAGFKDPILVAATDGVGTKLKIAIAANKHDTIGIDLVAMCVNDLVVQGAQPLFFLDYFATGKLENKIVETVVAGIADGCQRAGSALIGGETAEMPGHYDKNDYDLAGFAVGAMERHDDIDGSNINVGDIVLGLASSGIHSNGYSLVRKIVDESGLSYFEPAPFNSGISLGDALLEPTIIYVNAIKVAREVGNIKGIAHITGGGLLENLPRILPDGKCAVLNLNSWSKSPVFSWLIEKGSIEISEMLRTFNCGIGMVIIVSADKASAISEAIKATGQPATPIGVIENRNERKPVLIQGNWA